MTANDFAKKWSGAPLVTASPSALNESSFPVEVRDFLANVGLPSNALWFDRGIGPIMSFDAIAQLRCLSQIEVSQRVWNSIVVLGKLAVLGVHGSVFIVADKRGRMLLVGRDAQLRTPIDPNWQASMFVNQSPQCFAECLLAYRQLRQVFEQENYDFSAPAIRGAVQNFRNELVSADHTAIADDENYWAKILDDVDIW